jgi:hypothetical protein
VLPSQTPTEFAKTIFELALGTVRMKRGKDETGNLGSGVASVKSRNSIAIVLVSLTRM